MEGSPLEIEPKNIGRYGQVVAFSKWQLVQV